MAYFCLNIVSICSYSSSEIIPCFKRFLAISIVPWNSFSFCICSFAMTDTSKSVMDIALVGAIFPVLISINPKRLFTIGTYKVILCFAIDFIQVGIPPFIPAFIRAELLLFSSTILLYGYPTA